jgi:cellobiose phosphorylase
MTKAHALRVHVLSNGSYSSLLTDAGGGYSAFAGTALTRWIPDPLLDGQGLFLYLRDLETGQYWSIGTAPVAAKAADYGLHFERDRARYYCMHDNLEARAEVVVAVPQDLEVRRITVTNHGTRTRRLDLTTYAEVALNGLLTDATHPAFSKLFVQTQFVEEHGALLAWRRPRSPQENHPLLAHWLVADRALTSYETDRARFLGRGRSPARPRALELARLSNSTGNVLDPIVSLRSSIVLEPTQTTTCFAFLAGARTRDELLATVASVKTTDAAARIYADVRPTPTLDRVTLAIPDAWAHAVRLTNESQKQRLEGKPLPAQVPGSDKRSTGEPLLSYNGFGGFSPDGQEYVIRLERESGELRRPPLPWVNVIANERFGCLISEAGAGFSWSQNSRENRITPWSNDPLVDPYGEALYMRADGSGTFWSLLPGPCAGAGPYEVRHGFGYTEFRHTSNSLEQHVRIFVPRDEAVKVLRVRVVNRGQAARRISLVSYAQLVLGGLPADTRGRVITWRDQHSALLFARNPQRSEYAERVAFAHIIAPEAWSSSATTDRAEFLGPQGDLAAPAALRTDAAWNGSAGAGLDACFAQRASFLIPPGGTIECAFLLGEAESEQAARACVAQLSSFDRIDAALKAVRSFWTNLLGVMRIETRIPAFDLLANGWLAYQNLSCRLWARSGFYQSGGAFGFRDQLQDAAALLYLDPTLTRQQILLHAAHQFVEGDVLHWWHPPSDKGIRTRFSDDLLWLPYVTAFYLRSTGDHALLAEDVPFLRARQLEEGEDEAFVWPEPANSSASLWEHCCRALDRSLTRGAHGLPLMGTGDWNDGMNRVGRTGRGESVWLGFFLYDILGDFIPLCEQRGDTARATRYAAYRTDLHKALNDGGWDGEWYRRAYYDNGNPLGAAQNEECRIDSIAQAWAVLSGAAPRERAHRALDALERHLVSDEEGIIRLLAPPFDRTSEDPGYIKGYLPGARENGGQYTHGALWAVRALAEAGRLDRAVRLLEMLSPVTRTAQSSAVDVYRLEPYVMAADVHGLHPHTGRGGWSWYTGSAGWMFRVLLESILGFELRPRALLLRPRLPATWPGFRLEYRAPTGTCYRIQVVRGIDELRVTLDGARIDADGNGALIPLLEDGGMHDVRVALGPTPRSAPESVRYTESRSAPLLSIKPL